MPGNTFMSRLKPRMRQIAKAAATDLLMDSGFWATAPEPSIQRFPVEALCEYLQIQISNDAEMISKGELRRAAQSVNDSPWRISLQPHLRPVERRFIMAHEIGHWYLKTASKRIVPSNEEAFCNEFARELLLPQPVLNSWARRAAVSRGKLTVAALSDATRQAGVGFFPFIRQLMYEQTHHAVDPAGIALVARVAGAKKFNNLPDLRIDSVAPPKNTYLPCNRRLSSVGLSSIAEAFFSMKHGEARTYVGLIQLEIPSRSWATHRFPCSLEYVKLGQHGTNQFLVAAGRIIRDEDNPSF